jgi:hypothetical protein
MPPDQLMNPLMPNNEQMTFMFVNYPEYASNPVDLILWLYSLAVFNEEQVRM